MIEIGRVGRDGETGGRRGFTPSAQGAAGAMFTVGISDFFCGAGNSGSGPKPMESWSAAPALTTT